MPVGSQRFGFDGSFDCLHRRTYGLEFIGSFTPDFDTAAVSQFPTAGDTQVNAYMFIHLLGHIHLVDHVVDGARRWESVRGEYRPRRDGFMNQIGFVPLVNWIDSEELSKKEAARSRLFFIAAASQNSNLRQATAAAATGQVTGTFWYPRRPS
jgi:hypothetical protein